MSRATGEIIDIERFFLAFLVSLRENAEFTNSSPMKSGFHGRMIMALTGAFITEESERGAAWL